MRGQLGAILFFSAFLIIHTSTWSKDRIPETYKDSVHRQRLHELRERARSQSASGLQRNGLESLRQYNVLSDSLFGKELADTVDAFERQFDAFAAVRLKKLAEYQSTVEQCVQLRQAARSEFLGLLWKSLLALGVWVTIVVSFFRKRNSNLRRAHEEIERGTAQLQVAQSVEAHASRLKNELQDKSALLVAAASSAVRFSEKSSAEGVEWSKPANKLAVALERETRMDHELASLHRDDSEEKVMQSMNDLCDHFLELAYRGHCSDQDAPFDCSVSRDLEKNMVPIPLHPASTGAVLLGIFDNAFIAVKERMAKEEPGYRPQVAVSTKILPRFVQVRIKDNGNGMSEEVREKLMSSIYSTRPPSGGAGLGLFEAKRILTTLHDGEIIIESEPGKGTDVYLKIYR